MKSTFGIVFAAGALVLVGCGSNENALQSVYGSWTAPELNRTEGEFSSRTVITVETGLTRVKRTCKLGAETVVAEVAAKSQITANRWKVLESKLAEKPIGTFRCDASIEAGEVIYRLQGDTLYGKDTKRADAPEQKLTRVR